MEKKSEMVTVQSYKTFTVTVIDVVNRDIPPGKSLMTIEDAEKFKEHVFIVDQINYTTADKKNIDIMDTMKFEMTNEDTPNDEDKDETTANTQTFDFK